MADEEPMVSNVALESQSGIVCGKIRIIIVS